MSTTNRRAFCAEGLREPLARGAGGVGGHDWQGLPARQNAFPTGIDMPAHFGFVVAFAVGEFPIAFAAAGELVVIELDAQTGLVRDAHAAVHDGDPAA